MKTGNPTKVVLLNGVVTDTWSKEWAEECMTRKPLVDHVLNLRGKGGKARRESYCRWIGDTYGAEQEKRVREAVARLWKLEGEDEKEIAK